MMRRSVSGAAAQCQINRNVFEGGGFTKLPDGVLRPGGLLLTRWIVDNCAFKHGAYVVDIGCGSGITVEYLRDIRGMNAVGVDVSDVLLQQGRKRSIRLPLIRSAAEELPFTDEYMDGVLAECSLSVMRDVGQVLAEINRVLVPGGKLAITDIYARDTGCASLASSQSSPDCIAGVMYRSELTKLLKDNGFSVILWEDQSALLKEFIARFIMEHGSAEELWRCISIGKDTGQGCRPAIKTARLGYFSLIAEKR